MAGLGKQAKTLSDAQLKVLRHYVEGETAFPTRNTVIVLLSFRAGLRAKEIASVRWRMVVDAEGDLADTLALTNDASKGRSGRVIPLHADLRTALAKLYREERVAGRGQPDDFLIHFTKGATDPVTRSNSCQFLFREWYRRLGFSGASSHSGRRTFITRVARTLSEVGGSLRDVQSLAGHASLATTQLYIAADSQAQRKLIDRL
jgi:integrase/recombinase XerD